MERKMSENRQNENFNVLKIKEMDTLCPVKNKGRRRLFFSGKNGK